MSILLRILLLLAGLGAALIGAAPALATQAVSIDVGRIDVTDALAPGGEYSLPPFGVRNPGTEATTYRVVVSYVDGQDAGRPDEAWFTFSPSELTLGPGQSQPVSAKITLPPDAEPGQYAALIGPQIVAAGTGAQVGAAAAARLTFTVSEGGGLEGILRMIWRIIQANPWLLLIPILVLVVAVLWFLRKRVSITVSRRT